MVSLHVRSQSQQDAAEFRSGASLTSSQLGEQIIEWAKLALAWYSSEQ
jgi:hypothetical protein